MFLEGTLEDLDTERDLENWEAIEIHNAWLNDVSDWMNRECLQKYNDLINEADAAKGKSKDSAGKPAKGKASKDKGSAGKPAKGEAGKGGKSGPRQLAQQLKKQRFNKIISDIACKKALFMSFVRFPARLQTNEAVKNLLINIQLLMDGDEYKAMVDVSKKKSEELAKLKCDRDQARKNLRRGRSDYIHGVNSDLATAFKAGNLRNEVTRTEEEFGYRKQIGLTVLLNLPEDEEEE